MKTYADGLRDGFHEAAKALESRATNIEQVERATMKPTTLYYSPEVNTLKAAAAMLREPANSKWAYTSREVIGAEIPASDDIGCDGK